MPSTKQRKERIQQGLCPDCGGIRDDEKYVMCGTCRKKKSDQKQKSKHVYIDAGICWNCKKNPIVDGKEKCEECLKKSNDYIKELHKKRSDNQLCTVCGKNKPDEGRTTCNECASRKSEYTRLTRKFYSDNGICPKCGKNILVGDEKNCIDCWESNRNYKLEYNSRIDKDKQKKEKRECMKRFRQKALDNGLCPNCGKNKPKNGYKTCEKCMRRNRKKSKEYRIRIKGDIAYLARSEYVDYGLCYFCGEPQLEGYKVCEKHKKELDERLPSHFVDDKKKNYDIKRYYDRLKKYKNDPHVLDKMKNEGEYINELQRRMDNGMELSKEIPSSEE